jgi:putative peptide zinc metalloprotease protein
MSTVTSRSGIWGTLEGKVAAAGPGSGDLWEQLSELVDIGQYRPKLAPDIEVKYFTRRSGEPYYMMGNPRDLLFFRIGQVEYELIMLMDGSRTVKEIVLERFQESGEMELSGVADIVRQFRTANFFEDRPIDVTGMVERGLHPEAQGHRLRKFVTTLSAEWNGAQRPVKWLHDHGLRWALTTPFVLLAMFLAASGIATFVINVHKGLFGLTGTSLAIGFFVLLAIQYFGTFVHELGHALVLVHNGRRIKSAGFKIYFGCPAFFVDSSDGLMLEPRQRILQSFAGPYGQSLGAGVASILAWAFPEWALSETLYRYTVLAYLNIFLNCIPLLELDGYWMLSDFLRAPDLRPRSMEFLQHDLIYKIRTREGFSRQEIGLLVYGILGVVATGALLVSGYIFWKILFGGLVTSLWRGGIYTRVLLVGLGLFVLNPILRGMINLVRSLGRRLGALGHRVRFRLQRSWRVEAAELIDGLPLFEDVPEDVLSDLAGRVRLRTVRAGQPVVRQGERSEAFFVVRKGVLQVEEEDPEDRDARRILRSLERGEAFGELGLTQGTLRAATVRAVTDGEVFEIGKGAFDELLSDGIRVPEFAPTLQAVAELRALPAFTHLEPDEVSEVLERGEWVNVGPGQVVIRQGEPGDAFYAIQSGQAEVLGDAGRIGTMGPGDHFGEIALLLDVPRTATVRSLTPTRLFRLDRAGFDRLVRTSFRKGTLNPAVSLDRVEEH